MAPPSSFYQYPKPVQGPKTTIGASTDSNPELRGIPLLIGANLVSKLPTVQSFLWNQNGFGKIKEMPSLRDVPCTFHPCVVPLGETEPMLDLTPELLQSSSSRSGPRYYTANDYHEMYRSGKATPLQVVDALLPLIKQGQHPPGKYEDAWAPADGYVQLAIESAKESTDRWAAGNPIGILDGVPIGVKDELSVKGLRNFFGMKYNASMACFKKQDESAWPVKKLQDAGAIILGKNRMHQLGADTSGCNPDQGTPTNHHNNAYYPGGSTSGGCSALSAGVVPIVVASDAGGSARNPASFNGVYGLKTSHHRTMTHPYTMCVVSPAAATPADLTVAYRVMSQPNPDCPIQSRFALSRPPEPGARRFMGVYRDWWRMADPRVQRTCEDALGYFAREKGYEIVDIEIPHLTEARRAHSLVCGVELAESARERTSNPADWLKPLTQPNRIILSVSARTPTADFLKCNSLRELLMRHLAFLFQTYPGLLIMTPTTGLPGWPRKAGEETYGVSDVNKTIESMIYVFLANMTGTPALSAPVGYIKPDQGEGDLPIGMMATGEWGSEEQLLGWAREAEEFLHERYEGGRRQPKAWLDVIKLVTGHRGEPQ